MHLFNEARDSNILLLFHLFILALDNRTERTLYICVLFSLRIGKKYIYLPGILIYIYIKQGTVLFLCNLFHLTYYFIPLQDQTYSFYLICCC